MTNFKQVTRIPRWGEKRLPRHFERYELRDIRCWDVGMRCLFFLMAADIISLIFLAPKKRNTVLSHFFRTKAHLCAILILVMMRRTCAALYKIRYMKGLKWVEFNSDFSMGWNGLKWVVRLRISQAILFLNDVKFDLKPWNPNQFPDQKKKLEGSSTSGAIPTQNAIFTDVVYSNFWKLQLFETLENPRDSFYKP